MPKTKTINRTIDTINSVNLVFFMGSLQSRRKRVPHDLELVLGNEDEEVSDDRRKLADLRFYGYPHKVLRRIESRTFRKLQVVERKTVHAAWFRRI